MHRDAVRRWVEAYERVWRTPGTDALAGLFTDDATYRMSPWSDPVVGLDAIRELWDAERDGADEEFTMASEVVAVDGGSAVVRVEVAYAASGTTWRDLWVLAFADDDDNIRCRSFEEWPFAPEQQDGH